jgi:3-phosphoshikimate 1-carboxyvinyltransferase
VARLGSPPDQIVVRRPRSLRGQAYVPGDKSISHRAILHNAIAEGTARVENLGPGDDVRSTAAAMRSLGVQVDEAAPGAYVVHGSGPRLAEADDVIDAGNSGTTTRLIAGILAAQPFLTIVTGDESLRSRPMDRVIDPLRAMGAQAFGRRGNDYLPIAIVGDDLHGIDYRLPMASAQVKSCLLLAGALAAGETHIREPAASRDHTERLLTAQGADIQVDGLDIVIHGGKTLHAVDVLVPGDTSAAAFWIVAACIHPDAEITVAGVGLSEGRTGIFDVLRSMGADIEIRDRRVAAGETVGDVTARSSNLRGTRVGGDIIPRLIDEVPVLAVAAAFADGDTVISEAEELRYKESDRIGVVVEELTKIGAEIDERPDGMVISGTRRLTGGAVDSHKDHRMAMALAVAGLVSDEPVSVARGQSVSISYPSFWEDLDRLSRS